MVRSRATSAAVDRSQDAWRQGAAHSRVVSQAARMFTLAFAMAGVPEQRDEAGPWLLCARGMQAGADAAMLQVGSC